MIQLNNVNFRYTTPMHFDLSVEAEEKIAIVGASGSGKSTLLNLIAGFAYADSGEIYLDGQLHTDTSPFQRPVSMLFQDNNLFNHVTVADNIALGLKPSLKLTTAQKQLVRNVADQVGLADYLMRKPDQLSGGQKQRVALARCLLRNQPILLLDEPFSALDKDLRAEMLSLLSGLCQRKKLTLLMVTHQPEELRGFVERTITIDNGSIR